MVTKATSAMNVVWIQPSGPNTAMLSIPCAAIDSIAKSYGSIESTYCWNPATGQYDKTGIRRGTPDEITFSLEELAGLTASALQKAIRKSECPVPFYIGTYECAPRVTFSGYDRMKVIEDARIETETENNLALRDSQEDMMDTFDFNAQDVVLSFQLLAFARETAETETLRDIAICGVPACYGTCGPEADICHTMVAVAEAVALATANVIYTTDGGATWAATAADPSATADDHCVSVVCFPMDATTWRWIVATDDSSATGTPAHIHYSDDAGATWTTVNVTSGNDQFLWNGSLFALDRYHIWACTAAGDVLFSDDAGLTWTDQGIANSVDLNYLFFMDENNGCVVGGDGAANLLGTTTNGGTTWSVTTTIGGAGTDIPWCVTMHDISTYFIGDDQGEMWYTVDGGTTWTQRTIQPPAGMSSWDNIFDIKRVSRYFMFICGEVTDGANPFGAIGRTVNGGTDWELWSTVQANAAGDGLQAIVACHQNRAVAVGGPETTPLAMIYEVTD